MDSPDATEALDTSESIRDAGEADAEEVRALLARDRREEQRSARRDGFRQRAALTIAGLAMLLAIGSVGGGNATKNMLNANIQASDTFAFYQAKTIRQTTLRAAREQLEVLRPTLPPAQQAAAGALIESYRQTEARYESDPSTGEGKTELLAKATQWVQQRDLAQKQDPNFDYAQALFQIAIVLGSVSIVAASGRVLALALGLGTIATALMLNGFLLLVDLPLT
jgi:hypothetical protein